MSIGGIKINQKKMVLTISKMFGQEISSAKKLSRSFKALAGQNKSYISLDTNSSRGTNQIRFRNSQISFIAQRYTTSTSYVRATVWKLGSRSTSCDPLNVLTKQSDLALCNIKTFKTETSEKEVNQSMNNEDVPSWVSYIYI